MTKIILTERFKKDMTTKVSSKRVSSSIKSSVKNLETIPAAGSNALPDSIIEAFDENVRKFASPPFLIIYEFDKEENLVIVDALIHERQAY